VAAVCASPAVVLQTHGILEGKRATCYPADRFTGRTCLIRYYSQIIITMVSWFLRCRCSTIHGFPLKTRICCWLLA
jgi:hypothetical protein